MTSIKELVRLTVDDLVADFLYYGRKEDEELPVGAIEKAILAGDLTVKAIVEYFEFKILEATRP